MTRIHIFLLITLLLNLWFIGNFWAKAPNADPLRHALSILADSSFEQDYYNNAQDLSLPESERIGYALRAIDSYNLQRTSATELIQQGIKINDSQTHYFLKYCSINCAVLLSLLILASYQKKTNSNK